VVIDGRPVSVLGPAEQISVVFVRDQGALAQVAGTTFYHRLREKFGRLVAPL
jgi:NAD+ kinase